WPIPVAKIMPEALAIFRILHSYKKMPVSPRIRPMRPARWDLVQAISQSSNRRDARGAPIVRLCLLVRVYEGRSENQILKQFPYAISRGDGLGLEAISRDPSTADAKVAWQATFRELGGQLISA